MVILRQLVMIYLYSCSLDEPMEVYSRYVFVEYVNAPDAGAYQLGNINSRTITEVKQC